MDSLYHNISSMPPLIKIACLASFALAILQLMAFVVPGLSPGIEGASLSSPPHMLAMSSLLLIFSYGIYAHKKWAAAMLFLLPLPQYAIIYSEIGLPDWEALKLNGIFFGAWVAIFAGYFAITDAWGYFRVSKKA